MPALEPGGQLVYFREVARCFRMPTAVERSFENALLPYIEMLNMTRLLAALCGNNLRVTEAGKEWVRFHVAGMPDFALFKMLEQRASSFALYQGRFQVLCPQFSDGKPGIYLHHLSTPALREEYIPGFWVY